MTAYRTLLAFCALGALGFGFFLSYARQKTNTKAVTQTSSAALSLPSPIRLDSSQAAIGEGERHTEPAAPKPAVSVPAAPGIEPIRAISFARGGSVAEVVAAVEKVVGEGKAAAAELRLPGEARWLCLLVDDAGPYASLDSPWRVVDMPGLAEAGFELAPGPLGRKHSLYLAHVKQACAHQPDRGDRIVILTCPKERWPGLKLAWPKTPAEGDTF